MKRNYSDRLFKLNEHTGELEFNKDEARQFPPFRELIWRDKGGVIMGDPDGRKKYVARRELYYVYVMADPFTMFSILNKERRHNVALEHSRLKEIEGWKPDKLVKDAIEFYKEEYPNLTATAKAFLNSRVALANIAEDIGTLNSYNDELRKEIRIKKLIAENEDLTEEDRQQARQSLKASINSLNSNNDQIFNITKTLPERMDALDKLREKLAKEDNERGEVIGGGGTYNREDPN